MTAENVIAVFGATGRQGGAVARELLRRGRRVRAIVRDPGRARDLAELGAEVVRGDMDDTASLDAALAGAHGVYSVQTFSGPDGTAGEERQGAAVAEAAARAGVGHFVYASVGGAERGTGIPHFESKWRIERRVGELGLPATVLRPAFFAENFAFMGPRWAGDELEIALALDPGKPLQVIATSDLGVIAADVFADPETYLGRRIEIAAESLTGEEIADSFARAAGLPVRFRSQPIEELAPYGEEVVTMFTWFNKEGYQADVPAVRAAHQGLGTLADWARENWTPPAR
ncbi:NmrA/HSCARG family protein [Bailinhaonella thermotolerans]|uniref:NmrA/HSCARG family protein n=1 Tax=Bailinhaonella thermotolerans TaxID=1070861 RepID=A0A3A4B0F6_9ACTN|nr:NmrA/HSCARG family protein [Bailinhaonella thermotolerans]RJL33418.1 NmrA/HSCARG family protein [Bailinhaonella thermotolerans]